MQRLTNTETLSRRAVAAWTELGLGWMPGMLYWYQRFGDPLRLVRGRADTEHVAALNAADDCAPNLADHATLGCIEHGMLPEAWGPGVEICAKRWIADDGTTSADVHVHERSGTGPLMFGDVCPMLFGVVRLPLAEGLVLCLEAAAERRRQR